MSLRIKISNQSAYKTFKNFAHSINLSYEVMESEDIRGFFVIFIREQNSKDGENLTRIIEGNYKILNKMRSVKDYSFLLQYHENYFRYFSRVHETTIEKRHINILLSQYGSTLVSLNSTFKISYVRHRLVLEEVNNKTSYRSVAISKNGSISILTNKRGYFLRNNNNRISSYIEFLDKNLHYTFMFNSNNTNFAAVDPVGKFIFFTISGEAIKKLKLHTDIHLDLIGLHESKYIITSHTIYNFSGDSVYTSNQKYVFHYIDDKILIRENYFTQKLEIKNLITNETHHLKLHTDRLIHKVLVGEKHIVINYEDELLQFIFRDDYRSFCAFTKEQIQSFGLDGSFVNILLTNNILQTIELKN